MVRHNYASADNTVFSRGNSTTANPNFGLTSNKYELSNKSNSSVAELLTNTASGTYNEFLINYTTIRDFRTVPVSFPQITIRGIARSGGVVARLQLGDVAGARAVFDQLTPGLQSSPGDVRTVLLGAWIRAAAQISM